MKVIICSDIHDNIWNLATAIEQWRGMQAGALCFLGDFCAPFTLRQLAEGFAGPVHVVFGNNDGDEYLLTKIAASFPHVKLHGVFAELELDGCPIALHHYPEVAQGLAQSGKYRAVFSGHDHLRYVRGNAATLWANPGEIMGRFGQPSFGVYDTADGSFAHVELSTRQEGSPAKA